MALPERDDEWLLLHNPRCSKSRAARQILEERGIPFRERLYLEDPLCPDELATLRDRLGREPRGWVRRGEAAFATAGLDEDSTDAAILEAMATHPILIERPIALRGSRAVVGRPPEAVLELAED